MRCCDVTGLQRGVHIISWGVCIISWGCEGNVAGCEGNGTGCANIAGPKMRAQQGKQSTLLCSYFSLRLPCCALIFLRTYPAVLTLLCSYFSSHLPCCAFILFSLTLLCPHFIFAYPAVPLFFFALTLLCPHFTFTYPAVPLFFCALTLLCYYPAFRLLPPPHGSLRPKRLARYIKAPDALRMSRNLRTVPPCI